MARITAALLIIVIFMAEFFIPEAFEKVLRDCDFDGEC